jgi:hypothetical protein
MNKPSLSRALPMSKPTGPVIDDISKGAGFWPQLRHVHRSEREDLEILLRDRRRSPEEFYVSDTPSRLDPPRLARDGVIHGPVVTDVVVRSRKTGVARAYTARPGLSTGLFAEWVNQFAEDLDNGLFE